MAQCLNKNSEYRTKLKQSGIPEFRFYCAVSKFVEEQGRFPNLDEIPMANSKKYMNDTLNVKTTKKGTEFTQIQDVLSTTGVETIEDANIILNNTYKDLEVEIVPLQEEAIIQTQNRPSEFQLKTSIDQDFNPQVYSGDIIKSFDKLRKLYGINIVNIDNKHLNTLDEFKDIPEFQNAIAFIKDNQIFINTDNARMDAPIHEMTHLLLGELKFNNPDLYSEFLRYADEMESFERISNNNPNRTYEDLCEETFVDQVSKYLSGLPSDIDRFNIMQKYELHYNIKRLLDSVLMGQESVKAIPEEELYNMSFKDLAIYVKSNLAKAPNNIGTLSNAQFERVLSNTKSELMRKGDLREDCL